MGKQRAFTLVELLVVIAVIATLSGFLFPVIARSHQRALRTTCVSNLRQLGLATTAYLQDWDDRYPWGYIPELIMLYGKQPSLRDILTPYVHDSQVWRCPSDVGEIFLMSPIGFHKRTPPFYDPRMRVGNSSYAYPGIGWEQYAIGQVGGRQAGAIRRPELVWWLDEFRPWHAAQYSDDHVIFSKLLYNVLYCDGHVSQKTLMQRDNDMMAGWSRK